MDLDGVLRLRLESQFLSGSKPANPEAVLRRFGALQAQDYAGARWAIAQRTKGNASAAFDEAFTAGRIIRIHVLRPTWHFVLAEDIRWMLELTAPRIGAASRYYWRRAGLNDAILKRSVALIKDALAGGRQLTRTQIAELLGRKGIDAAGGRLPHILLHAEMAAAICSGALRGKQHTYALLDDRVLPAAPISHEAALTSLAERYFAGHGPATLRDFTWWSGLSAADAARGLGGAKGSLQTANVAGQVHWSMRSAARRGGPSVQLLPNYDEYIVAYTDRSRRPLLDPAHLPQLDNRRNPLFNHTIVLNGRIVGTWQPPRNGRATTIETRLFRRLTKAERHLLEQAIEGYGRYRGLRLTAA